MTTQMPHNLYRFFSRKRGFPNSPLFPTLEMKFTEIPLKVKQKLGFFSRGSKTILQFPHKANYFSSSPVGTSKIIKINEYSSFVKADIVA
ncbi:MAG: hypothetical protein NTX44_11795 [Ignavibacteriales bacterium]|nr:hypothetical protein [Ignavibacteriales bacterium]